MAALMLGALAATLVAQDGPGRAGNGRGYGGPPKTLEERAARQAACLARNDGVCPNGGPRAYCPGGGMGMGWRGGRGVSGGGYGGAGYGWRQGPRDGTGPRSANGTCPLAPANPASK